MLLSPDQRIAISNLGWVDHGSLWAYDLQAGRASSLPLCEAKYLSLFPCTDPARFAVLHHYDGPTVRISVHAFAEPARTLAMIERTGDVSSFEGDAAAFDGAPRYYTAYLRPGAGPDYYLLMVDAANGELRADRIEWFDSSYDHAYQGILGAVELPSGNVLIGVQRDSNPVLYDPSARRVVRKVALAKRAGNPSFQVSAQRNELWADDYDTLLKLDLKTLKVKATRRLQGAPSGTAHFIGNWLLNDERGLCIVARPFSGDVLALSMDDLRTRFAAKLGGQPLDAVATEAGVVIARDWKSGNLLKGMLRKKWLPW